MVAMERKALLTTFEDWHKRLDYSSSKMISNLDFVNNVSRNNQVEMCDACFKARHTRLPFPISEIKNIVCFYLVHCNVWEKYINPSLSKASYFFLL